ncbi:hypothetical protein NBO_659g0001 [Nosema bombycis CQ1]|uniref:Uncharacterized protein n=1 Tax=Nosema bombycis (strain CQ1 / CVCC 102059) TaxID=578461 RepID=R0MCZ9_NOSB1|nr:hypothetical protein NBO_659g0001 [Nosema bombycis CQ1]|eukprot:EOB11900.1 hypothetical protein NBO_659g0001 [Nosema bombycis CQ1]
MIKSIIYKTTDFKKSIKQEAHKTTEIKLLQNYFCLLFLNQWFILCGPRNAKLSDETYTENLLIKEDDSLSDRAMFESPFDVGLSSAQVDSTSLLTAETNLLPLRKSVTEYNFFYLSSKINEILSTTIPGLFKACREMKELHAKIYGEIIGMKIKSKTLTFLKVIEQIIKEKQEVYLDFEAKIYDLRLNAEKLNLIYKKATQVYQKIKKSLDEANFDVIAEHSDFITLKIFEEEERLSRNLITVKNTFEEDKKQADVILKILAKLLTLNPAEF